MTGPAGRPAGGEDGLAARFALVVGVVLAIVGVAGFIPNPILGDPAGLPFIVTGPVLDTIHLAAGMIALWIAFALTGTGQGRALIAFGAAWLAIVVLTFLSPNLFGILGAAPWYGVNLPGHLLHLALGLAAVAVGLMAGRDAADVPDADPVPSEPHS